MILDVRKKFAGIVKNQQKISHKKSVLNKMIKYDLKELIISFYQKIKYHLQEN